MGHRHSLAQQPGMVLHDRYEIIRPLGRGGMATALLVRDLVFERDLALKLLELRGSGAVRLLRNEFARLCGVVHPRLTRVHDLGSFPGPTGLAHYYTADFVAGTTLDEFASGQPWRQVVRPLCDAVHALGFLHGLGIRHGDLKPHNILVDPQGRGTLIDLGCAGPLGEAPTELGGTPAYLAPELLEGGPVDGRSDLYSVGVILAQLFELAADDPPPMARRLAERLVQRAMVERPSEAAELLAALGDDEPVLMAPRGRAPRLLGREAELRRFDECLARLLRAEPGPRALLLTGAAGEGKSRVLTEWKWSAQLRARVFQGHAAVARPIHALLARACGVQPLPPGIAGVLEALERLRAQGELVVLTLDAAELLEQEDSSALDALLRSLLVDDPLLLLCATRRPSFTDSPAIESVPLGPLGRAALEQWSSGLLPPGRVDALVKRTGGVAANVEATLSRLAAGTMTEADLEQAQGPQPGATDRSSEQPPALQRTGLTSEQHHALGLIAVLEVVADDRQWATEIDPESWARLAEAGWIRREGSGWRLARDADGSALRQALPKTRLAWLHRRVVEVLGERLAAAPERALTIEPRIVRHLALGGQTSAAESRFLKQGPAHQAAPRPWSAVAEVLVSQTRQAEVLLASVRLFQLAGRPRLGLSALARLLRLEPARRRDPACCFEAARCYHDQGQSKRALRYLHRATDSLAASHADAELRCRLVALEARVHIQRGQFQQALAAARAGLERCPEPALAGSLQQSAGIAASYLEDMEAARPHLEHAVELHQRSGTVQDRFRSLSYLAILEFRLGNLSTAIESYRAAVELAEREHLTPLLASALLNLGTALQRDGDWGGALDCYERALRLATALGRLSTEASLRLNLANLYVEIGSFDRGRSGLARAEQLAEAAGLTHLEGGIQVVEGEAAWAQGELDEARQRFGDTRAFHASRDAAREVAEADLHLALVELAAHDAAAAAACVDRAAAAAERLDALDLSAQVATLRGVCALECGDVDGAMEMLEGACALSQHAGQPLLEADARTALARSATARGDAPRASQERAAARQLWQRVAASLPPTLRDPFWQHPRRAELSEDLRQSAPTAALATILAQPRSDPASAAVTPSTLVRFFEVNQRINSTLSVDRVLEFAMDAAIELTGAERGFVLLTEPEQDGVEVALARNLDRQRVGQQNFEFSTSIAEKVIQNERAIITVDAQADDRFATHHSVHAMRLQSIACVPISSPDGVLGALYLDNRFQRGRFSAADLELLVAFANQVAIALQNARLHAALEERREQLEVEKRVVEKRSRGQAKEIERLHREVQARQEALEFRYDYANIIGRSAPMREVLTTLDRVIDSPLTVLIQGESGTGKELIARAVHFNSPRRQSPFVSINCAALPETLLESELFGHVRGAFTDASQDKEGLMITARGGTLFLDEIGDMSLSMQVKLLRALQEREVRPLGGTAVVSVDIRVVAATNKDLRAEVERGGFREDLYYRLGVVDIHLPPLRERSEDISALATAIIERLAQERDEAPPALTQAALRALVRYRWPGNVRQLDNVLTKAYFMSDRQRIDSVDLDLPTRVAKPRRAVDRQQFEQQEQRRILDALHQTRWNISEVARMLGIPRNTLYRKLRRYRIERPDASP